MKWNQDKSMNIIFQICIFVLFCLWYFSPVVSGMILVPLYILMVYRHKIALKKRSLVNSLLQRGTFIRDKYYARMAFYSVLGSSCLYSIFFLMSKIVKISEKYRRTRHSPEFRRDIANAPLAPKYEPDNSGSGLKYFFTPKASNAAQTCSRKEAIELIGSRCLVVHVEWVTKEGEEKCVTVRAIPTGSELLIPLHAIPLDDTTFDVTVSADYSKRTSSYSNKGLTKNHYAIFKDSTGKELDLILLKCPNIPNQKDMSRFFATTPINFRTSALELIKMENGGVKEIDLRVNSKRLIDNNSYIIHAGTPYARRIHNYPHLKCTAKGVNSEYGFCGSPIIDGNSNVIIGVHIAGFQSNTWYALAFDRAMYMKARQELLCKPVFVPHPQPEHFQMKNNLKGFEIEDDFEDYLCEQIGATIAPMEEIGHIYRGNALYDDRVEKHYFRNKNPALEETFGPCPAAPPKAPNGTLQINTTLHKLCDPKFGIPADLVDRAAMDYLETDLNGVSFDTIIRELSEEDGFFSVRSVEQALQGDETGVIRGINNGSSAGWCYGGKKTNHYDMDVDGDPYEVRKLYPYIKKDIDDQEIEWRSGRATFDVFKRCSKVNELLPIEKAETKTRSFYGNDMVYFINATRAVISIKHVLRKNMYLSECFVGMKYQGSEWGQFANFISKGGEYTNFVCGDFSGYDTQLPRGLLDKGAFIFIEVCRRGGMSESDIQFLIGALTSVVSPTILWRGHLVRMANGQPSGQPLTVELNSVVNSLLMRMAYLTIIEEYHPEFIGVPMRHMVRLGTYGDDNVMGVDSRIPQFNHTRIQAVFARWGIK